MKLNDFSIQLVKYCIYVSFSIDFVPKSNMKTSFQHKTYLLSNCRIDLNFKTASKKPQVRYLYTIISFLIQNYWVTLQWKYFVIRQKSPKIIDEDKFRFDTFKMISWSYLKRLFRIPDGVVTLSNIQYFTNWIEKSFSFIPISKYFSVKCLKSEWG